MPDPATHRASLTVSIVLFHSSPQLLQATLESLDRAVSHALASGWLAACSLCVVDHSASAAYRRTVETLLDSYLGPGSIDFAYSDVGENSGYGHGHNRAGANPKGLRLVLNPDVELAEDALSVGLAYLAANPDVALISPHAVADDGSQEFLCKRYPSVDVLLLRAFAPASLQARYQAALAHYEARDLCSGDQPTPVTLASGCFMLMRGASYTEVGGFDERYFLYFEDFDLSLRLAASGALHYLPTMGIVHHGGYAARKGWRHIVMFLRSGIRFFSDHGWRWRQGSVASTDAPQT